MYVTRIVCVKYPTYDDDDDDNDGYWMPADEEAESIVQV